MARFPIINGPDRSELLNALSARRFDRPFPVDFTIKDTANNDREVKLHVTSVGIEDGSGHSWLVKFQSADFSRYYEGYYRTDRREGHVVDVDEEKSTEQTVRLRLEGAMAYGYTIKVTFRQDNNWRFCGKTITFNNVRACEHHPLSRFCATPLGGYETDEAENVGLFIDSVETVEWVKQETGQPAFDVMADLRRKYKQ